MSPVHAVRTVLRKYAVFSGRARRSEYWWFVLFSVLVSVVTFALDAAIFGTGETTTTATSAAFRVHSGPVTVVASLALLLPSLGVAISPLHDTDRRGWWVFLGLLPVVGAIVLIVFYALDSTPGANRFGGSPEVGTTESPVTT